MMEGGHRVGRARRHSLAHIPASVYIWSFIYPPVFLFVCLYVRGSLSPGFWLTAHVGTVSKFWEAINLGSIIRPVTRRSVPVSIISTR